MQISGITSARALAAPAPAAGPLAQAPTAPQGDVPSTNSPWTNPAAAAALRSSAELLKVIEGGITQNYGDVNRVRVYAGDLRSTNDILLTATEVLSGDGIPENDQFLPLINRANGVVSTAEVRLSSKDIGSTWPLERSEILSSVRQARVLTEQVARSLA